MNIINKLKYLVCSGSVHSQFVATTFTRRQILSFLFIPSSVPIVPATAVIVPYHTSIYTTAMPCHKFNVVLMNALFIFPLLENIVLEKAFWHSKINCMFCKLGWKKGQLALIGLEQLQTTSLIRNYFWQQNILCFYL